jgi:hypothetical protein
LGEYRFDLRPEIEKGGRIMRSVTITILLILLLVHPKAATFAKDQPLKKAPSQLRDREFQITDEEGKPVTIKIKEGGF